METKPYIPIVYFHPGDTLKEKLEEMHLSTEQFAEQTELPSSLVDAIIAGTYSVSADIALAFEQTTKIPAAYWLKVQHAYDNYMLSSNASDYKARLQKLRRVAAVLL